MKGSNWETERRDLYRCFFFSPHLHFHPNPFHHDSLFQHVVSAYLFFCSKVLFVFQCFSTDTLALASCPTTSEVVKKAVGEVLPLLFSSSESPVSGLLFSQDLLAFPSFVSKPFLGDVVQDSRLLWRIRSQWRCLSHNWTLALHMYVKHW